MPPTPFDSLKPVAGRALESALNRALALDPDTQAALKPLDGRRVELALEVPAVALQIQVEGERLRVGAVFGEVIGVQMANAVRGALRGLRDAGANLAGSAAEFVVEESRDAVGKAELNAFHDDVDALRDDVERLAARVRRLGGGA